MDYQDKEIKPLTFILEAKTYRATVVLHLMLDEGLAFGVEFVGSPKDIDYEILDTWLWDCEKIFYKEEKDPSNKRGAVQKDLSKLILQQIKQSLKDGN